MPITEEDDNAQESGRRGSASASPSKRVSRPSHLQPESASGRQRRVSRDIVSALTRLELVRGKASEALHELKRQRSIDSPDGAHSASASVFAEAGVDQEAQSFHVLQDQLEEIKGALRETKGELAQVSYRAEVLESERRKYRHRVAVLEKRIKGQETPDGSWEVIPSKSLDASTEQTQAADKELSRGGPSVSSSFSGSESSMGRLGSVASVSSQTSSASRSSIAGDGEEPLPLAGQLAEKDQMIDRIRHQLDFYAGELRSKVEREQQLMRVIEESNARCKATEEQMTQLEDRFEVVQEECICMRTHREGVLRLSERCMMEAQRLGEYTASKHNLEQLVTSRDSLMNDLVVRCALLEEQVKSLHGSFSKLSASQATGTGTTADNSNELVIASCRKEIAWLKSCLLRQFLQNQACGDAEESKEPSENETAADPAAELISSSTDSLH
eukprot:scpid44095/ scgid10749/ 